MATRSRIAHSTRCRIHSAARWRRRGTIDRFAILLIRRFETEQPRAVMVGWDTLDAPNLRQQLFPSCRDGREFEPDLVEQLALLPGFVFTCGFASAKAALVGWPAVRYS